MSLETPFSEAWLDGPLFTSFYTRLYRPPASVPTSAVMVFVHGYMEHVGRYEAAHTRWASRGVAVFAYDARGFGRTALDEHRSASSAYGRTGGMSERMLDLEWALNHARAEVPGIPLFLMGHSMGAGLALSLATRNEYPPSGNIVESLSGIIASSPLVRVVRRAPSPLVFKLLTLVSKVLPNMIYDTPVQVEDLSHDPNVGPDSVKDPWVRQFGTLLGLVDMLHRGELLLTEGYRNWAQRLPVLLLHGDQDMCNSFSASKAFFEALEVPDKEFIAYPGMMHDLMSEPEVKERYFEDCCAWLVKRVSDRV
ncbi:lysophospholipase [Peniophora sp. CONT]|nr:lysophospholipase [Peniophora sp. CONT]